MVGLRQKFNEYCFAFAIGKLYILSYWAAIFRIGSVSFAGAILESSEKYIIFAYVSMITTSVPNVSTRVLTASQYSVTVSSFYAYAI